MQNEIHLRRFISGSHPLLEFSTVSSEKEGLSWICFVLKLTHFRTFGSVNSLFSLSGFHPSANPLEPDKAPLCGSHPLLEFSIVSSEKEGLSWICFVLKLTHFRTFGSVNSLFSLSGFHPSANPLEPDKAPLCGSHPLLEFSIVSSEKEGFEPSVESPPQRLSRSSP